MIEQSVKLAAHGYVFEPNDANTWASVKSMIGNFLNNLWKQGALVGSKPEDALATATALTAESIARSFGRYVLPKMKDAPVDYIVSGGGARNRTMMTMLKSRLEPLGCTVTTSETFGLPAEAKEAAAFALLAWMTWHQLPGNVPAATGARRTAILGQITYA